MNIGNDLELKDLISATSPIIKTLVDTFITPKLVRFRDSFKIDVEKFPITEHNFSEYYHRTFKKLVVLNTLVFNNSQRFLYDIYIPLTITRKNDVEEKYKIKGFPTSVSDEYHNILITDTAGMGKSTMMKIMFLDLVNTHQGIPLFVELRRLNKNKTLLEEIKEQLNSLTKDFDEQILLNLLSEGGFIIILDGYDEISLTDRDKVTKDIQDFISKANLNKYVITSRPEKALSSFGNFQEFKISPLTKKEAFELLRKYDNQGTISALLIKKLQEQEMKAIEEFLTNPLLVSLLFTAFEHKQVIPFKKYLFYRQVYDANFETHDLTKGESYTHDKYSKLEIDDFHRVLRHIGYNCFKLQKIEFSKDEILHLITEAKSFCAGLVFKESNFLDDLINTVPIFTQDGNYYRWSHKSLQEYFSAQFIYLDAQEKQQQILKRMFNHENLEKFINILDLYYDMDYKTFRNTIEKELVYDYVNYYNSNYQNFSSVISEESLNYRRELTFYMDSYLFEATRRKDTDFFDGEKLNKMLENCLAENNYTKEKFSGILIHDHINNFGKVVYGINYHQNKILIFNLLFNKKSNLVRPLNKKIQSNDKMLIEWDFGGEYNLIKITDEKNNFFNENQNVFEITNLLLKLTRTFHYLPNTEGLLSKKLEIESSLKLEEENDFFLDGI